jgi:hypothetical protein
MVDLAEIQKEIDEINLEEAIRTHDLRTAAACLRSLCYKIPPAIVKTITDYLIDPVTVEKHKYKEGPKGPRFSLHIRKLLVREYKTACRYKVLPSRKEIKLLFCERYGISQSTFGKWLAEYNKKKP